MKIINLDKVFEVLGLYLYVIVINGFVFILG